MGLVATTTIRLARARGRRSPLDLSAAPFVLVGAAMAGITLYVNAKGHYGLDFRGGAWGAGKDVLAGRSPYPAPDPAQLLAAGNAYIPPPLLAVLSVPLSVLPFVPAIVVWNVLCTAALVLALGTLGVRDWRGGGPPPPPFPLLARVLPGPPHRPPAPRG